MVEKKEVSKKEIAKFSKEKLVKSEKYANRKDILNVILENEKEYSFEEVDNKMNKFMKGKVK
ncbi:hypothetical protein [Mycobacteroides abscessus]|uniref:hypothetical protein n=1 Tax=unclassified Desemzia TaxID=2685243 RepID=UPI001A984AD6